MITSSDELQNALLGDRRNQGPLQLAAGNYLITPSEAYTSFWVENLNPDPYSVRVHVSGQPIRPGHYGIAEGVTFIPVDDNFCFELDHSSRFRLDRVILRSEAQTEREQAGRKETWKNIPRRGGGIRTTYENIGDDAWHIELYSSLFQALEVGIQTSTPRPNPVGGRVKGTMSWDLWGLDFDGCRFAIHGERIGGWKVQGGIIQLAETGLYVDGSGNTFRDIKFERNSMDVVYGGNSCGNLLDHVTAAPWLINDTARNLDLQNEYYRLPVSAIWRPCERPRLPKSIAAASLNPDLYEDHAGFVYSRAWEEQMERDAPEIGKVNA